MQVRIMPKQDTRTYFGVACRKCHTPILFGVDRSAGNTPMRPAVTLTLTCGDNACGWRDDYASAPVSRYRKGREGAQAVVVGEEE